MSHGTPETIAASTVRRCTIAYEICATAPLGKLLFFNQKVKPTAKTQVLLVLDELTCVGAFLILY
ncbi:hypothetical protein ASD8599_00536 [Ascidiaceihabitans donghaensis]|uniref:Uncharacterized protein n=1 Tax=Ascidiaceihabitans donghaensis TaxID=1510460 RepID=A0A2R8B9T3_9RHOB|nr:hypothetical protein ASD8599_00536 [Ascidiaceihabitans donghaensis]